MAENLTETRLQAIEEKLDMLLKAQATREHYTVAEAAKVLGRSAYQIRDHCKNGRIRANRRNTGRGSHKEWVISHEELTRYRREGLLPLR